MVKRTKTQAMREERLHKLPMDERMKRVLETIWQIIACDCLQSTDNGIMSQDEVIEIVLDASRPETLGGDKEAAKELDKMSYEDQIKIAKEVFKYREYGY